MNKYGCQRCKRRWYSAVTDLAACQVCGGALAPLPLTEGDRAAEGDARPSVFRLWEETLENAPRKPREA